MSIAERKHECILSSLAELEGFAPFMLRKFHAVAAAAVLLALWQVSRMVTGKQGDIYLFIYFFTFGFICM